MIEYKLEDIDLSELDLGGYGYATVYVIKTSLKYDEPVSDEMYSWIINPFPAYASANKERMKEIAEKEAKRYQENKEESLKLVKRIKNEFYQFLCTDSDYLKKSRH